jgi:hypothetical protein
MLLERRTWLIYVSEVWRLLNDDDTDKIERAEHSSIYIRTVPKHPKVRFA